MKEADALHTAGYEVHVIATKVLATVEPRDQALRQRIPWTVERIDLSSRWRWRARRATQMAARILSRATSARVVVDNAYSAFTGALTSAAMRTPANLYIAHYPPALPAAAAAANWHGALLAYDAEDFHMGEFPEQPFYSEERKLVEAIEARYLPDCSYVTAASPGIATALAESYCIEPPDVVLNVFPLDQAPASLSPRGSANPRPSVYWFSQTIGPNRGLESAVVAIGRAKTKPHLYLRGTPLPGFVDVLTALAQEAGSSNRLHILPPGDPDEMVRLAAEYDVGLCGELGHTQNSRMVLTNKLFTYCLAGVPPLMSDIQSQVSFARANNLEELLYARNDAAALADALDRVFSKDELVADLRRKVWHLAQSNLNWNLESLRFIEIVQKALNNLPVAAAKSYGLPRYFRLLWG